jgi:LysM repeat protein/ABC-type branched-subunit amino acid transport system substrate-binding protein
MKVFSAIGLFVFAIALANPCFSQKQVEISGVKYILYSASKDESVFSICQKYKVSQADLLKANPGLPAVLKAGTTVKIPAGTVATEEPKKAEPQVQAVPVAEDEYYYHKVTGKQTIFTIAKQYGIQVNDLIRNNPEITKGISVGQVLKIPVNQTSAETNTKQPEVSEYTVHPVVSGETLYSLEQRYGVSHEEMMTFNPALQNGLKTGMKLKIPVKKTMTDEAPVAQVNEKNVSGYKVEKGETLFSLASRFGVEVDDIKKANPSLFSRSLEAGETISIPAPAKPSEAQKVSNEVVESKVNEQTVQEGIKNSDCSSVKPNPKQSYKAAFLLPFYLAGNDNPSALNKEQLMGKISIARQVVTNPADTSVVYAGVNIEPKALGFLEFYEGALLAVDSLQRAGMNVEVYAFDVSNQKMINQLLQLDEMREMNLIVGPVYPELQETVASFAAKNRIPMISPLAATGAYEQNNSWYFKVSPTREYQVEQTALYVEKELKNRNFVMLNYDGNPSSADAQLAKLCKEKLTSGNTRNSFHEYNLQQRGLNEIGSVLSTSADNVFFIPTDNEAQVTMAITNLNTLSETSSVILVGSQMLTKLKSIQPENFHRVRLRFLSPYFVDYSKPLVRRVVGQYRDVFSAEPTQFSFQGYDVTYYFLSVLQKFGKDFRSCLPTYRQEMTQMNFSFVKVAPMGGFVNQSLFVTSYERNYDVLNLGTFINGAFSLR